MIRTALKSTAAVACIAGAIVMAAPAASADVTNNSVNSGNDVTVSILGDATCNAVAILGVASTNCHKG